MTIELTPNQQILQDLNAEHLTFPRDLAFQNALVEIVDRFDISKDPARPAGFKNRVEQQGIFVYAPSGEGKSRLVDNALKEFRHPENGSSLNGRYVCVEAPTPFNTKELMLIILKQLGLELQDGKEAKLAAVIRKKCFEQKINLICIDEFNRVNTLKLVGREAKKTEAKTLGESLASLMTGDDWPVALVISGIERMIALWDYEVFETAGRRIIPFQLDPVAATYRDACMKVFVYYLKTGKCESGLPANYNLFGRLRRAALDRLGVMLWYMQTAIVNARRDKSNCVVAEHFAGIYARKSRCAASANLFLARDWADVAIPAKLDYEKL